MKSVFLFLAVLSAAAALVHAGDDTPAPPEVQKLAESFVNAFKSGDNAALASCFHAPDALAKLRGEQASREAGTSPTPIDAAKETEKELKRQRRNQEVSEKRAELMRGLIAKHFGEPAKLSMTSLEVEEDEDSTADLPSLDGIEIRLKAADGTALKIEVEDAIKLDGVWKFKGRLEDDLTIELPED